jgi:GR25 family glycosyltransferase involved in LPS biosynthesis
MSIRYYLIHCDEHKERLPYVTHLQKQFDKEITIFKGVYTNKVPIDRQEEYIHQYNPKLSFGTTYRFARGGQIGCYLSHFTLIENIMKNKESDYSVIFEDDVVIPKNLHSEIEKIIKHNIDFDILFLGNHQNNKGQHIVDNIYHMDKNNLCYGTHALLINNKNIEKIYNVNCKIKITIDDHYRESNIIGDLTCLVVSPMLCVHANFKSNIWV